MNNERNRLLKVNLFISKYLLFSSPVVIGTLIWLWRSYNAGESGSILSEIFGWHFMIWFVLLIYFLISLIASTSFREIVLSKITRSEERDERETFISGRASKATFLFTLAVMIVLLFLSCVNFHMYKPSPEERLNGKKGTVSVGWKFDFLTPQKIKQEDKGTLINFKGVPLSQESIILLLILIHVGGYQLFVRKRLREL